MHYVHGSKYYEKIKDKDGEERCYGNLGTAYGSLAEYHEAIEYFQKSLEIAVEMGDKAEEG
ncbi:MAG: tetratricopeptide repeat protein [Nitrososphaeraceae archaeon]